MTIIFVKIARCCTRFINYQLLSDELLYICHRELSKSKTKPLKNRFVYCILCRGWKVGGAHDLVLQD